MNLKLDKLPNNITTVVIGVSAGPDSMALLHYINKNTNYKIVCAHINHKVRTQSNEEEEFLRNYCLNNNIIFELLTINNYTKNNFENEAREKRYSFYKNIANKYNTNYVLLAHHADDLIETVLMKIMRGSNLEGYAGIKELNTYDNIYIYRPLLQYTKEEILKYNKINQVNYYIDESNKSDKYTRNRYRNHVLPFLKEEDINAHKKFLTYSKTLLEYDNYIKKETKNLTNTIFKDNILDLTKYKNLDTFIQKNILYNILSIIYNNKSNIIKEIHISNILEIIYNNKSNLTLNLPNDITVYKEYNKLYISNNNYKDSYKIELEDKVEINNHKIIRINNTSNNGNNICRLNSNNISFPIYIRNTKQGDKIQVLGLNGHKLVKDILMENKIPTRLRDTYPLLVDANDNILWIPNLKKSKFNTKINEFCDIILEYCEKEENNEYKENS